MKFSLWILFVMHPLTLLAGEDFSKVTQRYLDVFHKKLEVKISEIKTNFVVEHQGNIIKFLGNGEECSHHPEAVRGLQNEVFRLEIIQKVFPDRTSEVIHHYACQSKVPSLREELITFGSQLKLLTREEILSFQRRITLEANETRREYGVSFGGSTTDIFASCKSNTESECQIDLSGRSAFYSTQKGIMQRWTMILPIQFEYFNNQSSYNGNLPVAAIESLPQTGYRYFLGGERVSENDFQQVLYNHYLNVFNSTMGNAAQSLISRWPKTKVAGVGSEGKFLKEFKLNLLRVQSGDMTGINEFLRRMDDAIKTGKIVIKDNGF